jgi:hypothetical protein
MSQSDGTNPAFHALLMGADCYLPNRLDEGSYPSLRGCVRDVRQVVDVLTRRLDQPIPKGVVTRDALAMGSALDQLVAAIAADQPTTRTLTPSVTPSREWTVAQVEVRIETSPVASE